LTFKRAKKAKKKNARAFLFIFFVLLSVHYVHCYFKTKTIIYIGWFIPFHINISIYQLVNLQKQVADVCPQSDTSINTTTKFQKCLNIYEFCEFIIQIIQLLSELLLSFLLSVLNFIPFMRDFLSSGHTLVE